MLSGIYSSVQSSRWSRSIGRSLPVSITRKGQSELIVLDPIFAQGAWANLVGSKSIRLPPAAFGHTLM